MWALKLIYVYIASSVWAFCVWLKATENWKKNAHTKYGKTISICIYMNTTLFAGVGVRIWLFEMEYIQRNTQRKHTFADELKFMYHIPIISPFIYKMTMDGVEHVTLLHAYGFFSIFWTRIPIDNAVVVFHMSLLVLDDLLLQLRFRLD